MALIAMAVYDTVENDRTKFTIATIDSLMDQVGLNDRLFIIDNASCEETKLYLADLPLWVNVITCEENIGTAKAINLAWKERVPGEYCVKMDNDVIIHDQEWIDKMVNAMKRDRSIGLLGLKRNDLEENPNLDDINFRTTLRMLPHKKGESWIVVEVARHIMGTVTMFSPECLDKIGYLYQPTVYGFDDGIASVRTKAAGFITAFLPEIEIDHIDPGGTEYTEWKHKHAGEHLAEAGKYMNDILTGKIGYYYDGQ